MSVFWTGPGEVLRVAGKRKGSVMLAPKLEPTRSLWGNCFVCAGEMRISLIEPHPTSDARENRTFECTRCVYTVDLT